MSDARETVAPSSRHDIDRLVGQMTLDEKASLTAGVDAWHTAAVARLGVPPVKLTDGPNGVRGATGPDHLSTAPSLCIPSGSALGATWDPELVRAASSALGRQAREKSARVLLAPTVNLHRHPLWGRNFECFSEDPFLSGKLAAAYIAGVQAQGVIATVKHLVCNETEHERRVCSSEVDERTLRELYLLPFEMAVREGDVLALMTSYNRVNGCFAPDDARLLSGILRGEWGFRGFVMTDWNALASTVQAAEAGLDLEMPGPARAFGPALAKAVSEGAVKQEWLDDKVRRLLAVFDEVGALGDPVDKPEHPLDRPEDRAMARRAAAAAMVLLANDGLLPLPELRKVAVIGPNADAPAIMGGGSAKVRPHYVVSPLEALRRRLGAQVEVAYEQGCPLATTSAEVRRGRQAEAVAEGIARAVEAARRAEVAVVVVGTNDYWESESYDRETMGLPGAQDELVDRVIEANPRTVVVVNSGAPVSLPFAGRAAALLQCWFAGQELGNALADVLCGYAEPGGRLPVTFPERIEHTPAFGNFPGEASQVRYGEGLLMGYRWYEARHLPVRFPFGHGLSYTSFRTGPVRTSGSRLSHGATLTVEVGVANTGARAGSEVVQLYVAPPGGGALVPGGRLRPLKQLKGFAKVHLAPGQTATVRLELPERAFAYYDVRDEAWEALLGRLTNYEWECHRTALHRTQAGWYVDPGRYQLHVGRSSADIAHVLDIEVEGSTGPLPTSDVPA